MYSHLSRDRTHSWGPVCPSVNTPVVLVNNAHVLPCVKSPCSEEWRSIVERKLWAECSWKSKGYNRQFGKMEVFLCHNIATIHSKNNTRSHQDSSKYFLLAHPPILFLRKSSKHHQVVNVILKSQRRRCQRNFLKMKPKWLNLVLEVNLCKNTLLNKYTIQNWNGFSFFFQWTLDMIRVSTASAGKCHSTVIVLINIFNPNLHQSWSRMHSSNFFM